MEKIDAKVVETGVTAVIEQLRAEKKEFWEEAVRLADEAGRLKALLHDAQRDAERLDWISNNGCAVRTRRDSRSNLIYWAGTSENPQHKVGIRYAIDAAMAAERDAQG